LKSVGFQQTTIYGRGGTKMHSINTVGIVLILFIANLSAVTRHVSPAPTGNDAANGSVSAPWATLQYAVDNIGTGDTVLVHPGTYAGFCMGWDSEVNGTKDHPIVIKAEFGSIINDKNKKTADGINLEGANYIIIDGFKIMNTKGTITRAGIRAVTDTGVIIRNTIADSCGTWGIFTGFSESIIIENNSTSRSVTQHGIYFSNSADNPVIRGNRSFSNSGCGIHMNGDVSMGGDGIISHALVENNVVYDNGRSGGSGINCDGVQHSRIQNNLLYNNHASGISLFQGDADEPAKNDTLANNTIIEASDARWCVNIKNGSTGSVVMNNILYNYHSWHGSMSIDQESISGLKSDFNVVMDRLSPDDDNTVMKLTEWQSSTGQDAHSLVATPDQLFANASGSDYRLKAASPAIDAGTEQTAPAKDIAGLNRINSKYDIGAYEYTPNAVLSRFFIGAGKNTALAGKHGAKTVIVDLNGRIAGNPLQKKNHVFRKVVTKLVP
jgi:parallel beta-helix repeat protein